MNSSVRSLTSVRHRRLRAAAALYLGSRLLVVAVLIAGPLLYFWGGVMDWRVWAVAGGTVLLSFLVAFLVARPLRCGACGQPSLGHSGKAKHAYASKWLGVSYRARVAWDVITGEEHFCMYCHSRIRHRSVRGAGDLLPVPPVMARPGLASSGVLPTGLSGGIGQASIFDAALLAKEPDPIFGGGARVTAGVPFPGPAGASSPAPAPAGPVPHPPNPVPVPPLPAMTSPAPILSMPQPAAQTAPVLPPPLPAAAAMAAAPPALPGLKAPVLPPVASPFHPELEALAAAPRLPIIAGAAGPVGDNPFVKQPAVLGEPPATLSAPAVAPLGAFPPPLPAPLHREPSAFFGPVRPPAEPEVAPPLKPQVHAPEETAAGPAVLPDLPMPATFPSLPTMGPTAPQSAAADGSTAATVVESGAHMEEAMATALGVATVTVPVVPSVAGVPDGLTPSMAAVLAALQQGQETLAAAFQTVISQLQAAMDQMSKAPPVSQLAAPPAVALGSAGLPSPVTAAVPSPVAAAPWDASPPLSMPPAPALPASGAPGMATSPTSPPAPTVPAWPSPPAVPCSAPPVSPLSPPATATPGFRVYPPLHPVLPAGSPPPPPALTAPVSPSVPAVSQGEAGLAAPELNVAPTPTMAPAQDLLAQEGSTPAPLPPVRRRPLPNLPKTVFEELGPTLAQAFAPSDAPDQLEEPGNGAPPQPPVRPLVPVPFPPLPLPAVTTAHSDASTAAVPPSPPIPAPPVGNALPPGFALPALAVPPGNSFMPVPPSAGTAPLPPALPEAEPGHPAVPAPFSFLQAVQPPAWPADDLPALPLSEETPMWTRTRGKTPLS